MPHIQTFTGEIIQQSEGERKPLGPLERKVYNFLRRSYRPRHKKDLQNVEALKDVGDIDRTLRTLKKKGWVNRIPEVGKNPKWEAKI